MKPRWKLALVLAGYGLAVVAGGVQGRLYQRRIAAAHESTMGGMYAWGHLLALTSAFLVASLVPTLLALWFLRGNGKLWRFVSIGSLVFAGAGLLAVLMPLAFHGRISQAWMVLPGLLGLAQQLGVPLWTGAMVLFAIIAPTRESRRLLLVAIGIELAIGVCAWIHWFVPSPPL